MGSPQDGQAGAFWETGLPHAGQVVNAIIFSDIDREMILQI
jgi:hypothetical protein